MTPHRIIGRMTAVPMAVSLSKNVDDRVTIVGRHVDMNEDTDTRRRLFEHICTKQKRVGIAYILNSRGRRPIAALSALDLIVLVFVAVLSPPPQRHVIEGVIVVVIATTWLRCSRHYDCYYHHTYKFCCRGEGDCYWSWHVGPRGST